MKVTSIFCTKLKSKPYRNTQHTDNTTAETHNYQTCSFEMKMSVNSTVLSSSITKVFWIFRGMVSLSGTETQPNKRPANCALVEAALCLIWTQKLSIYPPVWIMLSEIKRMYQIDSKSPQCRTAIYTFINKIFKLLQYL